MAIIKIEKRGERFVAVYAFDRAVNEIVKAAGFRFDGGARCWWTANEAAARAVEGDTAEVAQRLNAARQAQHAKDEASIEASRATDAAIEIPAPAGLSYLPYQKAGIAFAKGRNATLIADEMGLGKTIQALGVVNLDPSIKRVLVICPASLKLNWQREAKKWLVRDFTIGIVNGVWPKDATFAVINYDIIGKHREAIEAFDADLLVVDECHYVKNNKAQRTKMILGKWDRDPSKIVEPIKARNRVFMTGTPITNRPEELWPLLNSLDPQGLGKSWYNFHTRYCAAYKGRFGWDTSGASNLGELNAKLRASVMVRRKKAEVLTELPAKNRQVIALRPETKAQRDALAREQAAHEAYEARKVELRVAVELSKASDNPQDYEDAVAKLTAAAQADFSEMSRIRREVAESKVPDVIEHVTNALQGTEKVVVMAHHTEVINQLMAGLADFRPVKLVGDMGLDARQASVDAFQKDAQVRVFIGSIRAAGVGITLTAASHVVFAELDWTPAAMSQAEDRCHRIGQRDSVLVHHIVLDGSLDAQMIGTLIQKQAVADAALDHGEKLPEVEVLVPAKEPAATQEASPEAIAKEAVQVAPAVIEAVHAALARLSAMCDGAFEQDGQGFNKLDTRIGKSLAAAPRLSAKQAILGKKIVLKYHRQLPAALIEAIRGA